MSKQAVLLVSFGTSKKDTREKTIDILENEIREKCPNYEVYLAFTSKRIIERIQKEEGLKIDTVEEALSRMKKAGIQDVIVQPTHIMNGIENDAMVQSVLSYKDDYRKICFGEPLLSGTVDMEKIAMALIGSLDELKKDEAVVLMGHGSTHEANACYKAFSHKLKELGHSEIFLATLEGYPFLSDIIDLLRKHSYQKVLLVPFFFVAGRHVRKDMLGTQDKSWLNQLRSAGFEVRYVVKGLGEYKTIRDIYYEHITEAKPFVELADKDLLENKNKM